MIPNYISIIIVTIFLFISMAACNRRFLFYPAATEINNKPNIVLIMTDDQRPDTLTFMPTTQEELIKNGMLFENAFVTHPLCGPSRAGILTGKYSSNHGVLTNVPPRGGAPAFDDVSTIATWLDDTGYNTSFIGKYINAYGALRPYGYIPPGWDDWQVFIKRSGPKMYYYEYTLNENGIFVVYGNDEEDYSSDVLTSKAVDFIHTSEDDPFFLVLSYYAPHSPLFSAERHKEMFRTSDQRAPIRPENFNEKDMTDKPKWIKDREFQLPGLMDDFNQRALRSLMAVDDGVGEVMQALEEIGQRDNTLVIFMSDNGRALGEHRLKGKKCPYEECIRIPFVIYFPNLIKDGQVCDQMVLNIDVAPLIAQITGVSIPNGIDGKSLKPVLEDCSLALRDGFLIEYWPKTPSFFKKKYGIPEYKAIRTDEWKYVEYETGELELYDLISDKYELENLAYEDKYRSVIDQMASHLEKLLDH